MRFRLTMLLTTLFVSLLLMACVVPPVAEPAAEGADATSEEVTASDDAASSEAETTDMTATEFDETVMNLEGYPPLSAPPKLFDIVEKTEDTITVEHYYGEVTIPRNPQRIVAAYGAAEALIALGLNPIAYPGWDDVPQVLKEQAPEIIWVPIVDEGPNLEELAALEPDLILDWQTWMGADGDEANYELVSQIAPTLVSYKYPSYWQDYLRQLGELFDRSERAEEVIADYNAQIGPLRERVQAVIPSGETATTILFFGTDPWLYVPIEVYNDLAIPNSYISWLYNELGLLPSPEQLKIFNDEGWLLVSEEFYPEIQADHLVVFPGGYGGLETIDEGYHDYVERPIWKSISAVQADNVHEVVGVDIVFGYYTSLDALKTFADAVEE